MSNFTETNRPAAQPTATDIRVFAVTRTLLGTTLTAWVICPGQNVQVTLAGGDAPHIGAVTAADATGRLSTTQFPGHRDGVVSERWAAALARQRNAPAVVTVGIHYDNLPHEKIAAVLAATDEMLAQIQEELNHAQGTSV